MTDLFRFYVYAYLREDGTPYYIGKGVGKRAYSTRRTIPRPKERSRIIFLEKKLSNVGALALERRYIRWYGRKDIATGILRNMTDGGDNNSNRNSRRKPHSEETKNKLRLAALRRKPVSEETKRKLSIAAMGRRWSEDQKAKVSKTKKNNPPSPKLLQALARTNLLRRGRPLSAQGRAKRAASLAKRKILLCHDV